MVVAFLRIGVLFYGVIAAFFSFYLDVSVWMECLHVSSANNATQISNSLKLVLCAQRTQDANQNLCWPTKVNKMSSVGLTSGCETGYISTTITRIAAGIYRLFPPLSTELYKVPSIFVLLVIYKELDDSTDLTTQETYIRLVLYSLVATRLGPLFKTF